MQRTLPQTVLKVHANKLISKQSILNLLKENFVYVKTFSTHQFNGLVIDVMESEPFMAYIPLQDIELQLYCYEPISNDVNGGDSFSISLPTGHVNTLIMNDIPLRLLRYVSTCYLFDDIGMSGNKCVLLYGEPGSGKTSLLRVLSEWISIRFGETKLYHIDTSQFLSKYLGESSRLLNQLFKEMKATKGNVVLMMDEIESLARTREAMHSEPTDSIRIVNSLLVGLDSLKSKKGFFCFMTSNVLDMLDSAVVDRCDLRIKLEAPSWEVRFQILKRDVQKLIDAELVQDDDYFASLEYFCKNMDQTGKKGESISGRFVSKLCLLTYSFYVTKPVYATEFVQFMNDYVQQYFYSPDVTLR